jgi:hypothetical protein
MGGRRAWLAGVVLALAVLGPAGAVAWSQSGERPELGPAVVSTPDPGAGRAGPSRPSPGTASPASPNPSDTPSSTRTGSGGRPVTPPEPPRAADDGADDDADDGADDDLDDADAGDTDDD